MFEHKKLSKRRRRRRSRNLSRTIRANEAWPLRKVHLRCWRRDFCCFCCCCFLPFVHLPFWYLEPANWRGHFALSRLFGYKSALAAAETSSILWRYSLFAFITSSPHLWLLFFFKISLATTCLRFHCLHFFLFFSVHCVCSNQMCLCASIADDRLEISSSSSAADRFIEMTFHTDAFPLFPSFLLLLLQMIRWTDERHRDRSCHGRQWRHNLSGYL